MGLFSSGNGVTLPDPPSFQRNPYTGEIIKTGLNTAKSFINQDSSLPPSLQEAISANPDITRLVLQGLRASTESDYRTGRQNIIGDLEANNQLTSSTTASALGNYEGDYMAGLTAAGAEAGIADINRSMGARINLAQLGLGALSTAGTQALTDQGQENDFNLANYDNLVAKSLAEKGDQKGGILGALTGGLGGFLAGSTFGPAGMAVGALAGAAGGAFGPAGTGGSILNAGAGLKGFAGGLPSANKVVSGGIGNGLKSEEINQVLYNPTPFGDFSMAGGLKR